MESIGFAVGKMIGTFVPSAACTVASCTVKAGHQGGGFQLLLNFSSIFSSHKEDSFLHLQQELNLFAVYWTNNLHEFLPL